MSKSIFAAIDKLKKRVEAVPVMVEEACQDIAVKANGKAPKDVIVFAVGNTVIAEGTTDKGKAWAAYTEFGTGDFAKARTARLPQEWDAYALDFLITGEGKFPGTTPYLFPSYEEGRVELIKKIKDSFK